MQKTKKLAVRNRLLAIVLSLFFAPALSLAGGLVPSCTGGADGKSCDFKALMDLVNTVIHFVLYDMVIPIAAIMFAYAGFMMITTGAEAAGARTKAKNTFTNVVIGLIIAVAAFLIIRTILSILGYEGSWIGFNPIDP